MPGTSHAGLAPARQLPVRALLAAIALALTAPAAAAQDATEVQPYSLDEIVDLVSSKVPNKKVIAYAKSDCIGFAVDDDAVGRLRRAGADAALIEGLRGACTGGAAMAAAPVSKPAAPPAQVASRPANVPARPASSEPPVPMRLRAAIVGADFAVRVLPQVEFVLVGPDRDSVRIETNLDGIATASLRPGEYQLVSRTPVEVGGRKYAWTLPVTVAPGMETLELTQKNANRPATTLAAAPATPPVQLPMPAPAASTTVATRAAEPASPGGAPLVAASTPSGWAAALSSLPGPLAPRVRAGVFTVSGSRGRGTGVLVDPSGVVLTSASLVDADGEVRVQLDSVTRVRARVVEVNRQKGVAVLRVALAPCRGCAPLRIAGTAAAGARVFAVSGPGSRGGIASATIEKADARSVAIDLAATREQAGAPLLAPDGAVLGLVADSARVVPVAEYAGSIARLATSGAAPSDSLFPVLPGESVPASVSAEVRGRSEFDLGPYTRQLDAFRLVLMTPQVAAWRQARAEKEAAARVAKGEKLAGGRIDPIEGWVDWDDHARGRRPVVLVSVAPRANNKQSVGRGLGSLLGAVTGKINVGDIDLADDGVVFPYYGADELKEFYGDVREVTILKDGEPLDPVEEVRIPAALNAGDYASKSRRLPAQVIQVYRAEDFGPRPGGRAARFQVMVRDAASKQGKLYELDRRMITPVWRDVQQATK